ncbi:hypothetical protein SASPL_121452 [Salvia splendens]|uniref:Uncharacterized protein n=1 Tax=Salvia splendens TaxID=180675 RepID=A0A8X8XXB7_SALSN|nr:hypothetical protein SASPL_121452 [Salvia splendens]
MASCFSVRTTLCNFSTPSASLSLGSRTAASLSLNAKPKAQICSILPSHPPLFLSLPLLPSQVLFSSKFLSFLHFACGLEGFLISWIVIGKASERRRGLVVRASKYLRCQTKRNRSRKSLAGSNAWLPQAYEHHQWESAHRQRPMEALN